MIKLGWYTEVVVMTYLECEWCGKKGLYVEENREEDVLKGKR